MYGDLHTADFDAPAVVLAAPPMPAFAPANGDEEEAADALAPVRRLAGDIGYLNPNTLTMADVVFAFIGLDGCRALILDLRTHAGGEADPLLLGHLSWRPMPMATIRKSRDGVILTRWTGRATPAQDGPLFPEGPVFVLISEESSLAARALAYDLRMAGRATIVSADDAFTLAYRRALSTGRRAA
jgi:C-terminal processing protease CtpA/Prc